MKSAASQDDHSGVRTKIALPKPLYRPKWVGSLCAFKALSACMQFLIFENIFLKRDHFENCIFDQNLIYGQTLILRTYVRTLTFQFR